VDDTNSDRLKFRSSECVRHHDNETGDPRYAWVNTTFFIGEGRVLPGLGVEYRVWRPA
jgi:Protein of unknown function (DUF3237)